MHESVEALAALLIKDRHAEARRFFEILISIKERPLTLADLAAKHKAKKPIWMDD